jgi:hypothetical protein
MVTRYFFKNILTNKKSPKNITFNYNYKPQFKVKFNDKRFAKRFKVTSVLYKTKLPFKMALSINFEFAVK